MLGPWDGKGSGWCGGLWSLGDRRVGHIALWLITVSELDCLRSNPGSSTNWLCDLGMLLNLSVPQFHPL